MALQLSIKKRMPFFELDIAFCCPDEMLLALIGPSGGGKTTLVRMIAGLVTPDEGTIRYNEEIWFDSSRKSNMPPQRRRLGYVFQDYTLFPHLSLRDNVAFTDGDLLSADRLLERFGIHHLADRKPAHVSGGERQRCAICQALARKPRVLLMDEPFSALDFMTRRMLRDEVRRLRDILSVPIIYVTHDIQEAYTLADEILPVVHGKADKDWLQRSIREVQSPGGPSPSVREPRLALAF